VRFFRLIGLYRMRRALADSWRLLFSPNVPRHLKVVTLVLAVLIFSPLNILGDIPLIGIFDDIALLTMLASWFIGRASRFETYGNGNDPIGSSLAIR
jgi:uncharacterized membrane protein YkvA (DUF1232 family)